MEQVTNVRNCFTRSTEITYYKPGTSYLTAGRDAKSIFERSFRANFSKLCEGRIVIILDCTIIKADPNDDWTTRKHTDRHFVTVKKLVANPEFVGMNMPLQDIRDDEPILIIDACIHGRHRSVATK